MPDKKISSFSDLRKQNEGARSPNGRNNRDPDNLFTGGEKSGLAVQNPNNPNGNNRSQASGSERSAQDLVNQILGHATQNGQSSGDESAEEGEAKPQTLAFQGKGHSLKAKDGDENEGEEEGDEEDEDNEGDIYNQLFPGSRLPRVTRRLTFWRNGFTVEDGPLHSYDNPANVNILRAMERGSAPLSLLNVAPGQAVDVNVSRQLDQDYIAPKPKPGGYHGTGRRLGSPVPGDLVSGSSSNSAAATPGTSTPTAESTDKGKVSDLGEGDATVQLRLCDGSRHKRKFVSSGPIDQLYHFVESQMAQSSDGSTGREWVLQTTFPNKELTDKTQSLKEAGVVGAVVVQKWKA